MSSPLEGLKTNDPFQAKLDASLDALGVKLQEKYGAEVRVTAQRFDTINPDVFGYEFYLEGTQVKAAEIRVCASYEILEQVL